MTTARFAALFCLMLSVATAGMAADDYEIRMTRPLKAGDTYVVQGTGYQEMSNVQQVGDGEPQTNVFRTTAAFSGSVRVLAVAENGKAQSASIMIESFTAKTAEDAPAKVMLAKGTTVVATGEDDASTTYTVDGDELEYETGDLIGMFIVVTTSTVRDNAIFGSAERRMIGDSWPIAAAPVLKEIERQGLDGLKPKNVEGDTTLASVHEIDGVPCLQIKATVRIADMPSPFPADVIVETNAIHVSFSGDFPLDPSIRELTNERFAVTELVAKKPADENQPGLSMEIRQTKVSKVRYIYPKPKK